MNAGCSFAVHLFGAVAAFVILQKIAERIPQDGKVLRFLGRRSMAVYLVRQQIVYFFIVWFDGRVNPYFHATIAFVGVMVLSLTIATVLLKFKVTRFLIGEKFTK